MKLSQIIQNKETGVFEAFEGFISHRAGGWAFSYRGQKGKVATFEELVALIPDFSMDKVLLTMGATVAFENGVPVAQKEPTYLNRREDHVPFPLSTRVLGGQTKTIN